MYTRLGSTGLRVSKLCLGTWRFGMDSNGTIETDREEAFALLDTAWENGINFIDTANVYGGKTGKAEKWIGEWLQSRDIDREEIVIASKVYWTDGPVPHNNLSRKVIREEIEGSLADLETDYIDIYYIHRWDDHTPIRETLSTLNALVEDGKVNYLAASAMEPWQLMKGLKESEIHDWEQFTVTQPYFNAVDRPEAYLDVCADQDLAVCPFSPLCRGILTGKYSREDPPADSRGVLNDWDLEFSEREMRVLDAVKSVAEDIGATPAQVSLRWLIDNPAFDCVPIMGARKPAQIEENVGAFDIELSADQFERIDTAHDE